eukprot:2185-Heterococcus_DN1.PRE.1
MNTNTSNTSADSKNNWGGSQSSQSPRDGVLRRGAQSLMRLGSIGARLSPSPGSSAERRARRSLGDTHQVALVTGYLLNGEPPDVIEVLADKSPAPFSLNNFTEWATENLLEENLDFYFEVQAYKLCSDSELLAQCRALVDSFVRPGAETEVADMFNNL